MTWGIWRLRSIERPRGDRGLRATYATYATYATLIVSNRASVVETHVLPATPASRFVRPARVEGADLPPPSASIRGRFRGGGQTTSRDRQVAAVEPVLRGGSVRKSQHHQRRAARRRDRGRQYTPAYLRESASRSVACRC